MKYNTASLTYLKKSKVFFRDGLIAKQVFSSHVKVCSMQIIENIIEHHIKGIIIK